MSEYLNSPPQTHVYNLVAVLSHKGPHANSGHYSANICNSEGEWYQFSDEKVEKINHKRMEDETAGQLNHLILQRRIICMINYNVSFLFRRFEN